jgi:phosphoglycolate phosphatase
MGRKKYHGRRVAAFIFDLDGTLIDSGLDIAQAANFALGHFQLPELPTETIIPYIGDGIVTLLRRCLAHGGTPVSEERLEEALTVFRDHYGRHCLDHTGLYPGVLSLLARYQRIPMMIATHKPRAFTDRILEGLHVVEAFRKIVTIDEVAVRKPAPDILLACLQGLAVPPEHVVVVGDHPNDVAAARAIGAVAVGITYGFSTAGQIQAAKPDLVIDDFAALAELFPSRPAG